MTRKTPPTGTHGCKGRARAIALRSLAALVLATLPLAAADLNGKWTGTASTEHGSEPVLLVVKVSGAEVTGSIGPGEERRFPIEKANFDSNKFTFQITGPEGAVFHFELTLDGDSLKGSGTRTFNGESETGTVELKRAES